MIYELKLEPAGYMPGEEGTVVWNTETGELTGSRAERIIKFVEHYSKSGKPIVAYNMGLSTIDDPFRDEAAMATTLAAMLYKIPAELYPFLPKSTQDRRPRKGVFL